MSTPDFAAFTLCCARVRGKPKNTFYPDDITVRSLADLQMAVQYDHTPGIFTDRHRNKKTWCCTECLTFDVDNTGEGEIVTPEVIKRDFPGVVHYVVYSRHHNMVKESHPAAPRFHVYFPVVLLTDAAQVKKLLEDVTSRYAYFDEACTDLARFYFGIEHPQGAYVPGDLTLDQFMEQQPTLMTTPPAALPASTGTERIIPAGERHNHMVKFATQVLTRCGPDGIERARDTYDQEAEHLEGIFPQGELDRIWQDQLVFTQSNVWNQPGYLPPDEYAALGLPCEVLQLKLSDLSEVAEGDLFAKNVEGGLLHSRSLGWLVWDGCRYAPDEGRARLLAQTFTERQLKAAAADLQQAAGAAALDTENAELAAQVKRSKALLTFVQRCRQTVGINHMLTEAAPHLAVGIDDLDADPFVLNTPAGIVNLRTGEMRASDPAARCTKVTAVAPGNEGAELWRGFLDTITCNDTELADYLQGVAGMAVLGKVFTETLLIATGDGGNGKSTFFNTLARVLGGYSTSVSPDLLLTGKGGNVGAKMAALRCIRLALAAETEEGQRLDAATVKQLCSTDQIAAEPKYKDPFTFTPTHTLVLYTNFLPGVGSSDRGTWSRLTVLPFNARLRDTAGERKDFAEVLFTQAGGAVLSWMIEGARRFIANGYKLNPPAVVCAALDEYRKSCDWLGHFLESCCETGENYVTASSELYQRYTAHCQVTGDYRRNSRDFKNAMKAAGFECKHTMKGWQYYGLRLCSDFSPETRDVSMI